MLPGRFLMLERIEARDFSVNMSKTEERPVIAVEAVVSAESRSVLGRAPTFFLPLPNCCLPLFNLVVMSLSSGLLFKLISSLPSSLLQMTDHFITLIGEQLSLSSNSALSSIISCSRSNP